MLEGPTLHYYQVLISFWLKLLKLKFNLILRLVETELNTCVKATGTEGFFYQSQTLSSVESNQSSDTTTISTPASATTVPETESGIGHISSVTNDNDNLTLPPLDGTTPVVDIELEVLQHCLLEYNLWICEFWHFQLCFPEGQHQSSNPRRQPAQSGASSWGEHHPCFPLTSNADLSYGRTKEPR